MHPAVPKLPENWPYEVRPALPPLAEQGGLNLPGLGSGWTLCATLPPGSLMEEGLGLPGAYGRGGVRRVGEVILRPYRRGGLVRHFNARRYSDATRFLQECTVHRALWEAGFPTVEPLGFAWRPAAIWGVEGVFLTRFADGAGWPRDWSRSEQVLVSLVPAIKALSAWGLWAPDLNATNVHVPLEGTPRLLDWDRAAWGPPGGLLLRYRTRLLRSLVKLEAPTEVQQKLAEALAEPDPLLRVPV